MVESGGARQRGTHQLTNHSTVPSAAETVPMTTQYMSRVSKEARSLDRMAL